METQQLHRGRLIDHLQLVTPDLEASRRFYGAVLEALDVPIGGEAERFFWADELFVSAVDSIAAQGRPTGRCHLAFQAKDRAMVEAFHKAGLAAGGTYAWGGGRYTLYGEVSGDTSLSGFGDSYDVAGTAGFRVRF